MKLGLNEDPVKKFGIHLTEEGYNDPYAFHSLFIWDVNYKKDPKLISATYSLCSNFLQSKDTVSFRDLDRRYQDDYF